MTNFKKIVFINADYDENTQLATATIQYGKEQFIGYAKPYGTDADTPNRFRGCRIAELKATKKAIKNTLAKMSEEYGTIHQFMLNCLQTKAFDVNSPTAKVMFRQENVLLNRISKGEYLLSEIQEQIDEYK